MREIDKFIKDSKPIIDTFNPDIKLLVNDFIKLAYNAGIEDCSCFARVIEEPWDGMGSSDEFRGVIDQDSILKLKI